jgi:hypothetical protein
LRYQGSPACLQRHLLGKRIYYGKADILGREGLLEKSHRAALQQPIDAGKITLIVA